MDENVRRTNTKICSVCNRPKVLNGKNFYQGSVCGACYQKRYKQENPEKYRDTKLRHLYGITLEQFNEKLKGQNNKCAICKRPENAKVKGKVQNFTVDHRHADKKVRGLLCHSCNKNVGVVEKWLKEIQAYLSKY
jgi:ribosomal protein L34E